LDIGTLKMAMKEGAAAKSSPPIELSALTLDGKPLSLAQFKGKNVVLVFWTSWSERSREQLVELQKLQKEFASDPRLVFVGVSLDETADTARKSVDAAGYKWAQGWLEAEARAKLTAALNVNTLPAVFLLDSEGRIVARELEGERLPLTVKRVLAKK
jgi:thiol-disulfide isomerase/thioredoxin